MGSCAFKRAAAWLARSRCETLGFLPCLECFEPMVVVIVYTALIHRGGLEVYCGGGGTLFERKGCESAAVFTKISTWQQ